MNFIVAEKKTVDLLTGSVFLYLIWTVDLYKFSTILLFCKRTWITIVLFLSRWDIAIATYNICSADT